MAYNPKIKRGDKVVVTTGKYKTKEGKVLKVDRDKGRVVVEGVAMKTVYSKPSQQNPKGGISKVEGTIDISNVAYLHKGKPTKIGYRVEEKEVKGKMVTVKSRVAKATGEVID